MLATFVIEVSLIIYTLWRYKLSIFSKLTIAILGFLATFQLAEYMICGGMSISGDYWARIGFVSITMLPPLGIHLATEIVGNKKHRKLAWASYGFAAAFIIFFLAVANAIEHKVCGGNYIIFNIMRSADWVYALYYYGLLLTGVTYCLVQAGKVKKQATKKALQGFGAGYVLFLLPTTTLNLIDPTTTRAIPSIMCGFAVVLAFAIVFWVLPHVNQTRNNQKNIWERIRR
jgi:hypothetical protein